MNDEKTQSGDLGKEPDVEWPFPSLSSGFAALFTLSLFFLGFSTFFSSGLSSWSGRTAPDSSIDGSLRKEQEATKVKQNFKTHVKLRNASKVLFYVYNALI